jgi:hypothetical protein
MFDNAQTTRDAPFTLRISKSAAKAKAMWCNTNDSVGRPAGPIREHIMRPLIAGNWKMHGLGAQLDLVETLAGSLRATPPRGDVLIFPPSTLIQRMVTVARGRIRSAAHLSAVRASRP